MTLEEFKAIYSDQYNYMYHHASCFGLMYECEQSLSALISNCAHLNVDVDWAWQQVNDSLCEWDI